MIAASPILFVGVGSSHGDDQVGWRIADALQPHVSERPDVSVRKAVVPLDILDWLDAVKRLHICDAWLGDEPVGSLRNVELSPSQPDLNVRLEELQRLGCCSSHDFGLAAVLDLAMRLDRLPEHIVVHAVAGRHFDAGRPMSDDLAGLLPEIALTILEELTNARDVTRAVNAQSG